MNTKRILKVKVNGEKYLITGLQKAASYKDLLCALAKITTANTEVKRNEYTNKSYSGKEIVESNLLDRFKKDRETVGDYASLKVLNSLGKNAKIIAKTIEKTSSQRKTENREKHRKDKKVYEKNGRKVTSNLEHKDLNKKKKTKLNHIANNEKLKENRCLDDSDIDSYRGESLCRLKRHRSRVFDDSDLEVYKSLFNVVIDQTKKINKQNQQSKMLRRNQWIKELYRTSQVYYIDDKKSDKGNLEKEQDNDSGLPTPEYDSSDTTEIQTFDSFETEKILPITSENLTEKSNEEYMKIMLETNASLQKLDEKDTTTALPDKQINFQSDDKIECNLPNDGCNITPNDIKSLNTEISQQNVIRKNSNAADGKIIILEKNFKETLINKVEQLEKFDKLLTIENNSLTKESFKNDIIGETLSLGCNENIISPITTINSKEISYEEDGEGTKPTMVAFEAVLSKKSLVENKKLDKKKVNKIDISGPVLLSPSTFKKHKKLLDVKRTVEINDDILRNAVTNNEVERKDRNINDKEKRNLFNKKIKEIKKKKKPKSKDNSENIIHENNKEQDICLDTNANSENKKDNASDEKDGGINFQTDKNTDYNHENSHENNKSINKDPTPQNNESINELYIENKQQLNSDESTLENDLQLETNILSVPSQTLADLSFESDITLELSAREELLKQYIEEKKALDEIVIQIIECNLKVAEISEELNKYTDDNECDTRSQSSVDTDISSDSKDQIAEEEYNSIYSELEGVQILLKSVTEITGQQRKEMSANLAVLDQLDIEVKTKKAAVANMNVGTFTDNAIAAPRSLIKYTKDKRKSIDPSCFV